ncbi:MAG: DUF192 domain-containing protein [Phycisphaerales bacterium]|jgi:uncharacterized membrane protein (UPF0127 family)|nr:DUF192 domain-containing protein [Phycisphaerales bacterium]
MESILVCLLILCSCLLPGGCDHPPAGGLPVVGMKIGSQTFQLEVADTDSTRERGLMHRDSMPADHGMIFIFDAPQELNFYMKNTRVPLDIIFLDENAKVISIASMRPYDWNTTSSGSPALYAIELNQGAAGRSGVAVGDQLHIPALPK